MKEERKNVGERRKKIKAAKGPAQKQLEQRRKAINGNTTVSSKEDPIEWGTHTPAPTESEDGESEDKATKQWGTEGGKGHLTTSTSPRDFFSMDDQLNTITLRNPNNFINMDRRVGDSCYCK